MLQNDNKQTDGKLLLQPFSDSSELVSDPRNAQKEHIGDCFK